MVGGSGEEPSSESVEDSITARDREGHGFSRAPDAEKCPGFSPLRSRRFTGFRFSANRRCVARLVSATCSPELHKTYRTFS